MKANAPRVAVIVIALAALLVPAGSASTAFTHLYTGTLPEQVP
jgi:hypothetical protein